MRLYTLHIVTPAQLLAHDLGSKFENGIVVEGISLDDGEGGQDCVLITRYQGLPVGDGAIVTQPRG